MTDPIRAALERLIARLDETTDPNGPVPAWSDSFYAARAALAHPAPPAEGEVGELVRWLRSRAGIPASPDFPAVAAMLTRAADLLEQRRPAPVPVSERLPEPEDCDAMGRCWWFCPPDFMELRSHATAESAFVAGATHWLPANSLPLPAGEVQP